MNVDIDDLPKDLNAAYADGWIAYIHYKWAAKVAGDMGSPAFATKVDEIADDEEEYADELL